MKTKATVALMTLALVLTIGCGKKKDEAANESPVSTTEKHLNEVVSFKVDSVPATEAKNTKNALFFNRGVLKGGDKNFVAQLNIFQNKTYELYYREYEAAGFEIKAWDDRNDVVEKGNLSINNDGSIVIGSIASATLPDDKKAKSLNVLFTKNLKSAGLKDFKAAFTYGSAKSDKTSTKALVEPVAKGRPVPPPVKPPVVPVVEKASEADLVKLNNTIATKKADAKLAINADTAKALGVKADATVAELANAVKDAKATAGKLTKGQYADLQTAVEKAPAKEMAPKVEMPSEKELEDLHKLLHAKDGKAKVKIPADVAKLLGLKEECTIGEIDGKWHDKEGEITKAQYNALLPIVKAAPNKPPKKKD